MKSRCATLLPATLALMLCMAISCGDSSTKPVDLGYDTYKARIENASSSVIYAIRLEMVGVTKKGEVDRLLPGETSQLFAFKLPKKREGQYYPFTYGNYYGEYTQKNQTKWIAIMQPDNVIIIKIDDDYYSVE